MMKLIKRITQILIVFSLAIIMATFISSVKTDAAWQEIKVPVKSYELDKSNKYDFSSANTVSEMSFGKSGLGYLTITGNINETSSYAGKTAYGVETGNISFTYKYDGAMLDSKATNHIVSDKSKDIMGRKLDANILNGVMIVQKSSDGNEWTDVVNPTVNFFENNKNGAYSFYTTSGDDVAKGMFYRIILAYKTEVKTGTNHILWWENDKLETFRNMEVYEFFLCKNDATISVHNITADVSKFENGECTVEMLKRGETLTDGATVTKGFSIDKLNTSYSVLVNGVEAFDGKTFTTNGKYTITTKTKLGKQTVMTLYVLNGGEDMGYSTYFGDSFVQGKRVFREGEYPTYAVNSKARIVALDESVPIMTGTITNRDTGETITLTADSRDEQSFDLSEGQYIADLYSGLTVSGTVYHYTFIFNVLSDDAKPYVNCNKLMNLERLSDLGTKHYEVVYPTTAGGYIYVCFAEYEDAFAYAYEIEKRFVEMTSDGVYYKSEENPNVKVKYRTDRNEDKLRITKLVNYYARQNVEVAYFNANEKFTYQTFKSENELLQCLESMSIYESIKVFPSQSEKQKMIQRVPYLNEYKYMQVDDYDVKSVIAVNKADQNSYNIDFTRNVDSQLTENGQYTIIETNKYGDELSYDVSFMKNNVTVSEWLIGNSDGRIDSEVNDTTSIEASWICITSADNYLDDWAIVNIQSEDVYTFEVTCLVDEVEGLTLYKKGNYILTFVDRVGNVYKVYVTITGDTKFADINVEKSITYTELYNRVYLNDKPMDEENK